MRSVQPLWLVRPLGELVDVLDSHRIPVSAKERASRPGDVPYYGAAGPVGSIDKPLFDEPLVLLGEDGVQFFDPAKSKAYLIDGPAWVNNHAHVLRARPVIERKFLNYYLNTADYRGYANGTTRLKLTQAAMRRIPVPVPPLDEQRRIVAILEDHLSRLDAAETYLRPATAKQDLLRLSWLSSVRRGFREEPQRPIGAVATTTLGKMLDAKRQSGTSMPYLRNINVRWGDFQLDGLQTTPMTDRDLARFEVRPGDVMVCEGGEPGRCAVWTGATGAVAFQKALHRIRVIDRADLLPDFLALMLTEAIRSGRCDHLFTGTTIKHLPQEKLRLIEIPIPPIARQEEVVQASRAALADEQRLRGTLEAAVRRLAALRRSLLTTAFAGELAGASPRRQVVEEMIDA